LSEKAAEAPSDFVPVSELEEIGKFLKEGAGTQASAMLWVQDQEQVLNSHITHFSESTGQLHAWAPKGFDPGTFMDLMARKGLKECYFSLSLSRANVFFRARFLGCDDRILRFAAPDKVYKVQRRADFRFTIPEGHLLKCEHQDPLFPETRLTRKVIDISASGLAFVVRADERHLYSPELKLAGLSFSVDGRRIDCEAEVRHLRDFPATRPPSVKIGLRFANIRPGDTQHIAQWVFSEARKYYSRFL
jgi:hypothetical protein